MPPVLGPHRVLSPEDVAQHAYTAGFRGEALVLALAVAKAESNFDTDIEGDLHLVDRKWGPSVGLWQIRSLVAERGTRRSRDRDQLKDPAFNARSAWEISGGGNNFRPWSMYTNGRYKAHMDEVRPAASAVSVRGGNAPLPAAGEPPAPNFLGFRRPTNVLVVGGLRLDGTSPLAKALIGGTVDLTLDRVSEIALRFVDRQLDLLRDALRLGAFLEFAELVYEIVHLEVEDTNGVPEVSVSCHPAAVVALRTTVGPTYQNVSPTSYVERVAAEVGLRFVGQPSGGDKSIGPVIIPEPKKPGGTPTYETAWEVGQRLADELGYLFFESAGTLYFAQPTWLVDRTKFVELHYLRGATAGVKFEGDVLEVLSLTGLRLTRDPAPGDPAADVEVSVKVHRRAGEWLRPGMNVALTGVPQFATGSKIISRVTWSLDNAINPVTVTAIRPENPEIKVDPGAIDTTAGPAPATTEAPPNNGTTRISDSMRVKLFGPPGDTVRYERYTTPWGITVSVHTMIKDRFVAACADAQAGSSWKPRRIDSYANRPIRGGGGTSLHSWALAWDFFSSPPNVPPPGGVWGPESAPDAAFRAAFAKHGFYLGANFNRRKDYPHIEWAGAPPALSRPLDKPGGGDF